MKKLLIIAFLLLSFSSFAQKNFVGIDLFPIGKDIIYNGNEIELIYQRSISDKSIIGFKLYSFNIARNLLINTMSLDTCNRNSFYVDNGLFGIKLGYGHCIYQNPNFNIYAGADMNIGMIKGLLYAEDDGFCSEIADNHGYDLLLFPQRTRGTLLGIVPTINLQYQFWKNFVFTLNLGIELNYEINQRGYVNLDGELIQYDYTGFLSDFNRNYLIQDIGLLYRF